MAKRRDPAERNENGHKFCPGCGCWRAEENFYNCKSNRDGLKSSCKVCCRPDGVEPMRDPCARNERGEKYCRCGDHWVTVSGFYNRAANKDKLANTCKDCLQRMRRERFHTDISYKLRSNIRTRIHSAFRRGSKSVSILELIGCSIEQFKQHLESLFQPGMSWNNYGKWHVDHKIPCASFNLKDPKQQRECFNYRNVQPLWACDNRSKGTKLDWQQPARKIA